MQTTVRTPTGETVTVEHPEGATDEEIIAYAQDNYRESAPDPSAGPFGHLTPAQEGRLETLIKGKAERGEKVVLTGQDIADVMTSPAKRGLDRPVTLEPELQEEPGLMEQIRELQGQPGGIKTLQQAFAGMGGLRTRRKGQVEAKLSDLPVALFNAATSLPRGLAAVGTAVTAPPLAVGLAMGGAGLLPALVGDGDKGKSMSLEAMLAAAGETPAIPIEIGSALVGVGAMGVGLQKALRAGQITKLQARDAAVFASAAMRRHVAENLSEGAMAARFPRQAPSVEAIPTTSRVGELESFGTKETPGATPLEEIVETAKGRPEGEFAALSKKPTLTPEEAHISLGRAIPEEATLPALEKIPERVPSDLPAGPEPALERLVYDEAATAARTAADEMATMERNALQGAGFDPQEQASISAASAKASRDLRFPEFQGAPVTLSEAEAHAARRIIGDPLDVSGEVKIQTAPGASKSVMVGDLAESNPTAYGQAIKMGLENGVVPEVADLDASGNVIGLGVRGAEKDIKGRRILRLLPPEAPEAPLSYRQRLGRIYYQIMAPIQRHVRVQPVGGPKLADAAVGYEKAARTSQKVHAFTLMSKLLGLSEDQRWLAGQIIEEGGRMRRPDGTFAFTTDAAITPQILSDINAHGVPRALSNAAEEGRKLSQADVEKVMPFVNEWHVRSNAANLRRLNYNQTNEMIVRSSGNHAGYGVEALPPANINGWARPQVWLDKLTPERVKDLIGKWVLKERRIARDGNLPWDEAIAAKHSAKAENFYARRMAEQIEAGGSNEGVDRAFRDPKAYSRFHRDATLSDGVTPIPGATDDPALWVDAWIRKELPDIERARFFGPEDSHMHQWLTEIKRGGGDYAGSRRAMDYLLKSDVGNKLLNDFVTDINSFNAARLLGLKTTVAQVSTLVGQFAKSNLVPFLKTLPAAVSLIVPGSKARYRAEMLGFLGKFNDHYLDVLDPALAHTRRVQLGGAAVDQNMIRRIARVALWPTNKMDGYMRALASENAIHQMQHDLKIATGNGIPSMMPKKMQRIFMERATKRIEEALPGRTQAGETVVDIVRRGKFTEEELDSASMMFQANTNFGNFRTQLPGWVNTPHGRFTAFLGKFPYQAGSYVWDNIIKPYGDAVGMARKGKPGAAAVELASANARLAKFGIGSAVLGEAIGDMKATIDLWGVENPGRFPTWDEISKKRRMSPELFTAHRLASNLAALGSLGMWYDFVYSVGQGFDNDLGRNPLLDMLTSGAKGAYTVGSALAGDEKKIEKLKNVSLKDVLQGAAPGPFDALLEKGREEGLPRGY